MTENLKTKEAKAFIKKYALTDDKLSYAALEKIFYSLGFKIIVFNKLHNKPNVQALIDAYELQDYITSYKSFILANDFVKLLFLHEYRGEDELIHYMLHELGHIWLKHMPDNNGDLQEREADEFAVQVKMLLKQRRKIHKAAIFGFITAAAVYFAAAQRQKARC